MSTMRAKLAEMLEKLEQERDELKVRMHLGKAEAREEWEKMENESASCGVVWTRRETRPAT